MKFMIVAASALIAGVAGMAAAQPLSTVAAITVLRPTSVTGSVVVTASSRAGRHRRAGAIAGAFSATPVCERPPQQRAAG